MPDTEPQVLKVGLVTMQVCVPSGWTDEQIVEYANQKAMTGLDHGWSIIRNGDAALGSYPERNQCEQRKECVHVLLEC